MIARLRHAGAPGLSYTVEASTDLLHWTSAGVSRDGDDGAYELTDTNAAPARTKFYRLREP